MALPEATNPADGEVTPEAEVEIESPETDTGTEGEDSEEQPEPETEEVEYEGKKYTIPKPLKSGLLMQADYTRKTQEVAQQRKDYEERAKAFEETQRLHTETLNEHARVVALNDAIAQFEKADWASIRANNPQAYDELRFQFEQTKDQLGKAQKTLADKVQERNSKAQAEQAKRDEEFRAALTREVPELSNPEYGSKLTAFAVSHGFTTQELSQVRDPRIVKMLNAAYVGSQIQTKAAATTKAKVVEAAKPLPTVSGTSSVKVSPTTPAGDRLSPEEWARRRREQIQKKPAR